MTADERAELAQAMNKLPFVTWDRFTEDPDGDLDVYGWIARDDGRSDFVMLVFPRPFDPEYVGFSTSSAEYSKEIGRLLHGGESVHFDCQRVDEHFGDLVDRKTTLS